MIQNVETSNESTNSSDHAAPPSSVRLDLTVREAEVITELIKHDAGPSRDEFSLSALRLGVLALRQANGVIDCNAVKEEGQRLVGNVRETMSSHSAKLMQDMHGMVKAYFDPNTGALPQRLERLVKKDGELEAVLGRHLNGDSSTVAQTLAKHIGEESPIFKLLSPTQTDGLFATLTVAVEESLKTQQEHILAQFSFDKEDSALSRLRSELTDANGNLKAELSKDMDKLVKEFSADTEGGALNRLTTMMKATDKRVADSLTLDDNKSPMSRLRSELLKVVTDQTDSNTEFQNHVRQTLDGLKIRREEAARSTVHGIDFEDAVGQVLQSEANRFNDLFEPKGSTVGVIRNCKVGDHVITLGLESAAPNAKIAFESKADASYTTPKALQEMKKGRENRAAQVGVFVFSKAAAPEGLEPLARHGHDIIVVWDQDDPTTDVILRAAYSLARALVIRERSDQEQSQADFQEIERAIAQIAKDATGLSEISKWADTVKNSGDKIYTKAERLRVSLEKQTKGLREHFANLKQVGDREVA